MVTQEAVNRWCEVGKAMGKTPSLADTLWRFDYELSIRKATKAALIEMYEYWYDHPRPELVEAVVTQEMR